MAPVDLTTGFLGQSHWLKVTYSKMLNLTLFYATFFQARHTYSRIRSRLKSIVSVQVAVPLHTTLSSRYVTIHHVPSLIGFICKGRGASIQRPFSQLAPMSIIPWDSDKFLLPFNF